MNPKLLRNIDYPILIIIILITIISILVISSATHANAPWGDFHYTKMQLLWFCLGLISMICVMMVDYHSIVSWSNIIYVLNIVGLVSVLFLGKKFRCSKMDTDRSFWVSAIGICQACYDYSHS